MKKLGSNNNPTFQAAIICLDFLVYRARFFFRYNLKKEIKCFGAGNIQRDRYII